MNILVNAFARNRSFLRQLGWGVFVGLLSGLGTLLFVVLMNLGIRLVWPKTPGPEPFSGSVRILLIMTAAGLIVGLIHHFLEAEPMDEFGAMVKGRLNYKPVPATLLVALVSLIGGFSLGPEVPTGLLGAGLGSWLSEHRKLGADLEHSNVLSGVLGAWGGLFTSPFATLLMPLELAHLQTPAYYGILTIVAVAAVVGFSIFYAASGNTFAGVLRILDLPDYSLRLWHLVLAVPLGILGVVLALLFGLLRHFFQRLAAPLDSQPVIRGTLGGFVLGLLGMALPLTLFLGTAGLQTVTEQGAQLGLALVIVMVFAKIVATTGAFSTGFIGGPIFPLLFVGGAAGTAINLIFPGIPLALAVACMMAAVPGALLPIPLSLSVVVLLIVGLPATESIPVFISVIVAYAITRGLGLLGGGASKKQTQTAKQSKES
jgi:H+/Cl- antiporter ClcA